MTPRRFVTCLLILPFAVLCAGCALRPDHVTVFCERDVAEIDGNHRQRTATVKTGASATYDLR